MAKQNDQFVTAVDCPPEWSRIFRKKMPFNRCAGMMVHAQDAAKPEPSSDKIETVEFRGAKRISADTLKALVTIKPGDTYDEKAVQSDTTKLWNTGRFSDITVKKDAGDHSGVVVRFRVTERSN